MVWNFEILKEVPIGGNYEEKFFGRDQSGNFTWIKFFYTTNIWYGVFQNGGLPNNLRVFVFQQIATVLSDGLVYVIDLLNRDTTLIQRSKNAFQDLITDDYSSFAADYNTIHVIENGELVKIIEGYYFDQFRFVAITETMVLAEYYQFGGDWSPLEIDRKMLKIK